jgi:hypothetical protein
VLGVVVRWNLIDTGRTWPAVTEQGAGDPASRGKGGRFRVNVWQASVVDQAVVALHQVALAIRDRVTPAMEQASGVPLRWRLQDAAELMTYGEAVIGLENLCSNLYEFDVPLRESDYERIEAAGEVLELPETTWTMLRDQVAPDSE